MPYSADKMRGVTPTSDLIDAKTGEVVIRAGEKVAVRRARELADGGLTEILVPLKNSSVAIWPRTSST